MESGHEEPRYAGTQAEGSAEKVVRVHPIEAHFIHDLQYRCGEQAKRAGFRDEVSQFPELVALMHSELSEALEEYRNHRGEHEVYFTTDKDGLEKPEGIAVELADCMIRIMHWAHFAGVDMGEVIDLKLQYNAKRPYKHGGKKI